MILDYEYHEGLKVPFIITCPIEFSHRTPVAVSLTAKPCEHAENKLIIIDNLPPNNIKKTFGVCTKYLFFEDRKVVARFIEWVEMVRILGADKITLYNRNVHPEHFKILNYYKEKGFLEFFPFLEPSGIENAPTASTQFYMIETLLHTDCFYRTRKL